jgi:hypothetical protein
MIGFIYSLRAGTYNRSGQHTKAISDLKKAADYGDSGALEILRDNEGINYTPQRHSSGGASSSGGKTTGKLTYQNGMVYEGEIVNGKAHGKGKMTMPGRDGFVQEGDFLNGKLTKGKSTSTGLGGGIYEGNFVDGKLSGIGKIIINGGSVQEGEFLAGVLHGRGKKTFPNGKVEEGNWENGKFIG